MTSVLGPVSPRSADRLAVRPLGLRDAALTGGFWGRWQQANREVTTRHALGWLERDGSVDNLRLLGGPHRGLWFSDSDVYKVLEAISWDIGRQPTAEFDEAVSGLAGVLRAAQEADGYLNSNVQAGHEAQWNNLITSHELYCIGHLIQAGVAHRRAAGGDELFDIARRAADCVAREFGERRRKDTDGHPEIEMALVELYRETGDQTYLDLARQLLDVRGHGVLDAQGHFDSTYFQDAVPVREQSTVAGHAVRALYLVCGVVDVYLETGERALLDSALRQWESMTATKTYLTGAVGSRFDGEAFGEEYELPPDLAYGETCATIANIMLCWRLLLATGEGRFADAIERALYNLLAASTSVERTGFFYNNPVQRRVARPAASTRTRPARAEAPGTRPPWFACACCPPNIMRTVASLGGYLATYSDSGVQLHQYVPATIRTGTATLAVATEYPRDGAIEVTVLESADEPWTLALRVPAWCRGATVAVNDTPVPAAAGATGYLSLERQWRTGDRVALTLPMPVRLTVAHPSADALRGAVAIERGPVVYCLESVDQPDGVDVNRVELCVDEPLHEEVREGLLGEDAILVTASGLARDDSGWAGAGWAALSERPPEDGRSVTLTAIPYHLWANRGPSVMRVFIPARRAR
ncbi:glycoside hydrolase family 127 protein [Actinoplanes subtropicus]|uniref:glycoside hydrolase family 127 protein n=1 Tax=Actinoplanes subtropicus TaxID=543632 RepID=UPI000550DAA1|nr:beta-L-arabinofuranosidase domain-containing protein [Actinoplanes subtropicus]